MNTLPTDWRLVLTAALCIFLVWLAPGCNSGRVGTGEITRTVQVATSQPVRVDQDVAAVLTKLGSIDTKVDSLVKVTTEVRADFTAYRKTTFTKNTWGDSTILAAVVVLAFLMFAGSMVYANRQARRHGFWAMRSHEKSLGMK